MDKICGKHGICNTGRGFICMTCLVIERNGTSNDATACNSEHSRRIDAPIVCKIGSANLQAAG